MFQIGQHIYSVDFETVGTVVATDSHGFTLELPEVGQVSYPWTSDPAAFEVRT